MVISNPTPHHESMLAADHIFFSIELTNKFDSLYTSPLLLQSVFVSVSQFMYRNSNLYYRLLLLLSGDISLNPGPFHNFPAISS